MQGKTKKSGEAAQVKQEERTCMPTDNRRNGQNKRQICAVSIAKIIKFALLFIIICINAKKDVNLQAFSKSEKRKVKSERI